MPATVRNYWHFNKLNWLEDRWYLLEHKTVSGRYWESWTEDRQGDNCKLEE